MINNIEDLIIDKNHEVFKREEYQKDNWHSWNMGAFYMR